MITEQDLLEAPVGSYWLYEYIGEEDVFGIFIKEDEKNLRFFKEYEPEEVPQNYLITDIVLSWYAQMSNPADLDDFETNELTRILDELKIHYPDVYSYISFPNCWVKKILRVQFK